MCPQNDDITIIDGIPVGRIHTSVPIKDAITENVVSLTAASTPASYSLVFPPALGLNGQVLATDASGHLSWQTSIEWDEAHENIPEPYSEVGYDGGGRVSTVEVYESSSKVTHMYSKSFVYTGSNLTSLSITRLSDGAVLLKTFSYSDGKLSSITKTYTP